MSGLSPDARRLVDATRDLGAPSASERVRMRAALHARLAAPAAATAGKAAAGGLLAKAAAGALVLAALGAGAARSRPSTPPAAGPRHAAVAPRSAPTPAPAAPTLADREPPPVAAPLATIRHAARRAPAGVTAPVAVAAAPAVAPAAEVAAEVAAAPTVAPPPAPVSALASELGLLGEAQVALDRHHGERALLLVDRYADAHPAGTLREEALALRVFALCDLGRSREAREAAARLLREAPRSPSTLRVRSSCALAPR